MPTRPENMSPLSKRPERTDFNEILKKNVQSIIDSMASRPLKKWSTADIMQSLFILLLYCDPQTEPQYDRLVAQLSRRILLSVDTLTQKTTTANMGCLKTQIARHLGCAEKHTNLLYEFIDDLADDELLLHRDGWYKLHPSTKLKKRR